VAGRQVAARKSLLFLKKKKQKNFFSQGARRLQEPASNGQSFFASFCSQKEDSSCPLPFAADG
jgi:hypothetical protein